MFNWLSDPSAWAALGALSVMEIALGIDNLIFISLMISRLAPGEGRLAKLLGLILALACRLGMLALVFWAMTRKSEAVFLLGEPYAWRDIILFSGGLFLIIKAAHELHAAVEGVDHVVPMEARPRAFAGAMLQIALIDFVFSVDSVVAAIGMSRDYGVMAAAIVLSIIVLYAAGGPVTRLARRHPTIKVLALAFLIAIGVMMCMEAAGDTIPRGWLYAAIGFAIVVEAVNIQATRRRRKASRRRASRHEDIVRRVHERAGAGAQPVTAEEQAARQG